MPSLYSGRGQRTGYGRYVGARDRLPANKRSPAHKRRREEKNMELSEKHREYWHRNLLITAILLFIWFIVTFVEGWYARELNAFTIFGFPFGFYMSAQGSLIVYVVLIWFYARYMNALDMEYNVEEGEDE
jgi:putative solute:sodium symporter small subunit